MSYRASRQASTKFSPYFMLFQKEMRLPIHNDVCPKSLTELDDSTEEVAHSELIKQLLMAREDAFKKAEENILVAQKQQRETYDRKHEAKILPVGSQVLLENSMQKQRKGGKLEPVWLGPYLISRDVGKGLYELTNKSGKVLKKKANIYRLREYKERSQKVDNTTTKQPSDTHKGLKNVSLKRLFIYTYCQTYYDVYILCPLYCVNISCSENPQLDRSVNIDLQVSKVDNTTTKQPSDTHKGQNNVSIKSYLFIHIVRLIMMFICPLYWVNISCSENPQLDRSVDIDLQKQDNTM